LDEPYPENLAVVGACSLCNVSFSEDEEYFACLLSCVITGSTDPERMPRAKIKRILEVKPALRARIEQSRSVSEGKISYAPEGARVLNVVTKFAQGHAMYELHELCSRAPDGISIDCLPLMGVDQRFDFENPPREAVWPEVGSRMMQRLMTGDDIADNGWIEVQPERYRFHVSADGRIEVRIMIHEYLACRVFWEG
jgi:hypothetical protein